MKAAFHTLGCKVNQYETEAAEITVKVVHGDGSEKEFPISTTAENLGDALVEEGR